MPDDALPQPWLDSVSSTVALVRTYLDVLGRPMRGSARITGAKHAKDGGLVVAGVPVTLSLDKGVLSANLPPGTYVLTTDLISVDNERERTEEEVTLL